MHVPKDDDVLIPGEHYNIYNFKNKTNWDKINYYHFRYQSLDNKYYGNNGKEISRKKYYSLLSKVDLSQHKFMIKNTAKNRNKYCK